MAVHSPRLGLAVQYAAAAKGLPRNVAFLPPSPPPLPDDDDDDEEDDSEPFPSKQGGVEAFVGAMAPFMPGLMSNWSSKPKQTDGGAGQAITHLEPCIRTDPAFIDPDLAAPEDPVDVAFGHPFQNLDEVIVDALAGAIVAHCKPVHSILA